ncbi:GNAT family N-acetyltransferase [Candidatus Gracilibacteria bacterium]|nr:GNAT family N-acetyltransferase [Candidatus Gracilibacteria bacterium]
MSHEEIEHRFSDSPERIEKIKEAIQSDNHKFFVARDEGKIVGFISLIKVPHMK